MPAGQLPSRPGLQNLRKRAKTLRRAVRAGEPKALATVEEFLTGARSAPFALAAAQLVVARTYGFPSWRRLREYLKTVSRNARSPHRVVSGGSASDVADEFLRLACLTYGVTEGQDDIGRFAQAHRLPLEHPHLGQADIYTAAAVGNAVAAACPRADAGTVAQLLVDDPTLARESAGPAASMIFGAGI
jgi:hypothetical protein